jgi:hypothetical protein
MSSADPTLGDINTSDKNDEFARLQYQQAIETYRTQLSMMIQSITVLVVADATVVGYAINAKAAGILLIGVIFPIAIMYISRMMFYLTLPTIYVALSIEEKYASDTSYDMLASTFISFGVSMKYVGRLKYINSLGDWKERMRELRNMQPPLYKPRYGYIGTILLIVVTLGQIIAPVILNLYYGWKFLSLT